MPHKDLEVRKAYHKKYNQIWERKKKRYKNPKRRAYVLGRYVSGTSTAIVRKSLYGVTPEDYTRRNKEQRNLCAICGKKERRIHYKTQKPQSLSVDHDHRSGKVRGLLCSDCNIGLGMFQDDLTLLLKAVKYLQNK
jgi:Recombination endonuclease VII